MSEEAMRLALRIALENFDSTEPLGPTTEAVIDAAQKWYLAKPDFWEGYVPEPDKRQQALDKKAENARELGLDYGTAQQEPFTYYRHYDGGLQDWSDEKTIPLYTSPPAQQEYERGFIDGMQEQMKRSVDRAVNAMAQRTWVGLTDEEILQTLDLVAYDTQAFDFAYRIEAKLKEKNT